MDQATPTHVRTTVSEKGRVVIPAPFREALGLKAGTVVDITIVDDEVRISTFRSRLERAQKRVQQYATPGRLASEDLIAERREEARREEQEHQEWMKRPAKTPTVKKRARKGA